MKPKPEETELIGEWVFAEGKINGDATCERVEWLTANYLKKVAGSGWETLYVDPEDGRF
jgi:hypothetical protein